MDERRDETGALEEGTPRQNMDQGGGVGFREADGDDDIAVQLQRHDWKRSHDRAHVDLLQEEYTPEEAARLIGTSLEVVMHAAWSGELKAERKGRKVICIQHADLTDWLRRRAAE